jgi:hypothetical protein
MVHAVEDIHQRRLTGAILAEERQHLAAMQFQANVLVGNHTGEPFGDIARFENNLRPGAHGYSFSYTFPIAAGGRARPTNPASTAIVNTYGSIPMNCGGRSPIHASQGGS